MTARFASRRCSADQGQPAVFASQACPSNQYLNGSLLSKCQTHRHLRERLEELFTVIAHSQNVESMSALLVLTLSPLRLMVGASSCTIQHLLELTRQSHSQRLLRVHVHVISAFCVTPLPPRATVTNASRADTG